MSSQASRSSRAKRTRDADAPFTGPAPDEETATAKSRNTSVDKNAAIVASGSLFGAPPNTIEKSTDARNPRNILGEPGVAQIIDIEDIVRRQLAKTAANAQQGGRLFVDDIIKRKFVVRGLSSRVPNPEYAALESRRSVLQKQFNYVQRQLQEYNKLFHNFGIVSEELAVREQQAIEANQARLDFLQGFKQPQALSLLKPSTEIANLNKYWRTELSRTIVNLRARYAGDAPYDKSGPLDEHGTLYRKNILVGYHVVPIVSRRLEDVKHAAFEDMPYTQETVREYFEKYVVASYDRISNPPQEQDVDSFQEDTWTDAANSLGDAFRATDQNSAVLLAYYSSVLAMHANSDYRVWWADWKTAKRFDLSAADETQKAKHQLALSTIGEFIDTIIRSAEEQARANGGYVFVAKPMPMKHYQDALQQLIENEVALHRISGLWTEAEVAEQLDTYFQSLVPTAFPRQLLDVLPQNIEDDLRAADERARLAGVDPQERTNRIEDARKIISEVWPDGETKYPHAPNDKLTSRTKPAVISHDEMVQIIDQVLAGAYIDAKGRLFPDEKYEDLIKERVTEAKKGLLDADPKLAEIDKHVATIRKAIQDAIPAGITYQQYLKANYDTWSKFDLSYPIERDLSAKAKTAIEQENAFLWPMFDFEAYREKADTRRMAFDNLYANRRLVTELSQVQYLLKHVITPTIEQPLDVQRLVYDNSPLLLEARLDLAPELAAKIYYVPAEDRALADTSAKDALNELNSSQFEIEWHKRATEAYADIIVATSPISAASPVTLNVMEGRGFAASAPENVLAVAGEYYAVVWQLDNNGARVGDPIRSLYVARVKVVAECVRDHALYVPRFGDNGVDRHRECSWRASPIDAAHMRELRALDILVHHGHEDYKSFTSKPNIGEEPISPPWGFSSPQHILQLLQQGDNAIRALFRYERIVDSFVARFASIVRREEPSLAATSDLQTFGAVVAKAFANGSVSSSAMAANAPANADATSVLYADAVKRLQTLAARPFPSAESPFFSRTSRAVPLPTLIDALRLPVMTAFQTARERRFFEKIAVDYESVMRVYVAALANAENIALFKTQPHYSSVADANFRRRVADDMAEKGIDDTLNTIRNFVNPLPENLFYDDASEAEFRHIASSVRPYELENKDYSSAGNVWLGAHSLSKTQPVMAAVQASKATIAVGGKPFPDKLILKRRGSEPLDRGYDYAGLQTLLERAIAAYNAKTQNPVRDEVALQQALDAAGRFVTLYNYFAFLAQPLPPGNFMSAAEIDMRAGGAFFNVTFIPTPFERAE